MRWGHRCVLIGGMLLLVFGALAGEPADTPEKQLTLEQKLKKAHELLGAKNYAEIQELLGLIHEVGVGKFLEPYVDDEAKLVEVVEQVMYGSSTTEKSMTRADVATYLLKDKRAKVRDLGVKHITRLALYCDKPYVTKVLFGVYEGAKNDAELRVRLAKAFCVAGSVDRERREPKARPPLTRDDRERIYKGIQTMFRDPDPRVRRVVVENINTDPITMRGSGIGILEDDPDAGVRAAVIDYYRETRVKTDRVMAMALKAIGGSDLEELESAVAYCAAMKLDEAREPLFAAVRRYADVAGSEGQAAKARQMKFRIVDLTVELEWAEATPDLLWIVENDSDPKVRNRAAHAMLKMAGHETVRLGTTNEVFPQNMVEAETTAMMTAFRAWLIRHHEAKGETAEVKQLEEEAQIEFSDKVYEIATQRLLDGDVANKRRGLRLVMDIGPEEFAQEVKTPEEMSRLFASLVVFVHMRQDLEANRQFARLMLPFAESANKNMKMVALQGLMQMAAFCDQDVCMPVMTRLRTDPDPAVAEAAKQVGNAIHLKGYSGRAEKMEGKRRYEEGPSKPKGNY